MSKRKTFHRTSFNTDETLVRAADDLIRNIAPESYEWTRATLYDQIVAIHEARKAIRRQNARKR